MTVQQTTDARATDARAADARAGGDQREYVIETSALTKRYGDVVAVNDLTLRVPRGGVFGFLGPNGSGKTTTMGMLLGLVHPTSGGARIFGDPAGRPATLRLVGAMIETPTFYPYLSGRANLRYFQGIGRRGLPADIDRLLTLVDLGKRADSKFATYSLGMKQRLGIACALLGDPELVFLDEPTNGLDPQGMADVRNLIIELGKGERTVLVSSHLLGEVEQMCTRIGVIRKGKLVAEGTIDELRGKSTLVIRAQPADQAMAVLAAECGSDKVKVTDDGAFGLSVDPARAAELNRRLVQAGIDVSELHESERSLEDVFMELTGTVSGL